MTTTTAERLPTLREAVGALALILDRFIPGWAGLLEGKTIKMRSACDCVLGHIGKAADPGNRNPYSLIYNELAEACDEPGLWDIFYDAWTAGGLHEYHAKRFWEQEIGVRLQSGEGAGE